MGTLSESFSNERIDLEVASSMSDSALADLGVNTIGDRIRLRELCKSYVSDQRHADEADESAAASCVNNSYRARKEPQYSNPAALVGEAVTLEGGENGRTRVRIRKGQIK